MGYLHIDNLYKNTDILGFKECFAMEKIHGTSAHVSFSSENGVVFFSGGETHSKFVEVFDEKKLLDLYNKKFVGDLTDGTKVIIFGEAYGGKQQGMSGTYGPYLKFVAFDVKIGDAWLNVLEAEDVVKYFGLEFVHYELVSTDLESLNAQRDADSVQAVRNGVGEGKIREGVVLRPLFELKKNNGQRIISKHKRVEFRETKTPRIVSDEELKVIADARKACEEWVTAERLRHVLDKIPKPHDITKTGDVINAMYEDINREGYGEVIPSKLLQQHVGKKTAIMYKKLVTQVKENGV